jgi:elongation factor P
MFTVSDLRKGLKIELDGEPYEITEFDFRKPGKGQAMYRCKVKHMLNGNTFDQTFRSADKIAKPDLLEQDYVFSYDDGNEYVFVDEETFEQIYVAYDVVGDKACFLENDIKCEILFYKDQAVDVTLPAFVECRVEETEPGARGDTATNVTKPAKLENGYELDVPIFVNQGDLIKVDTRTGEYRERVNKA